MPTAQTVKSAFFITFNGNCKEALSFYQSCFGGELHIDTFTTPMNGLTETPVITGFLTSNIITIYGSDLVADNGRRIGNFMAIYVHCTNHKERLSYLEKLAPKPQLYVSEKLIEITDVFDVVWLFGI
ncbi:MAG: hypothetical protein R2805_06810 [Flavobacterium sp.]|jgi:uncharacterized glyoxalase superfamily protein PhnB|uniref:hypothetical protein n=1 Tax=Flavobacterium sp. TaxID=239 RepID=UPI002C043FA0|nr:hypothetical protein [Flavobacterium sp.]HQA75031.1 hypothetical protein [Flavobacterium sp.]